MNSHVDPLDACQCCEGVQALTPAVVENRPGLSALAYRVGTHGSFKATMQVAISHEAALRGLKTRADDDPTMALLDAWATVLDVLTFYQERLANESYLRTATERRSVLELARAIGYELNPGVAASADLAFEMETAPGAPEVVTLEVGTRVQSQPGPGELPQTFETIEAIEARPAWNALRPQLTRLRLPAAGDTSLYLQGVTTNLRSGDALLIVGEQNENESQIPPWEFRRLTAVEPDPQADRTLVRWQVPLQNTFSATEPLGPGPQVYALRLRAALFGHNAPLWEALPVSLRIGEMQPDQDASPPLGFIEGAYAGRETDWADKRFDSSTTAINLDTVYPQIARNNWIVLAGPTTMIIDLPFDSPPRGPTEIPVPDYQQLYRVGLVTEESVADFNLSAKTTRLTISGELIEKFSRRTASVYAQSEALAWGETPLADPVWYDEIVLEGVVAGMQPGRRLMISGKRMRLQIGAQGEGLPLISASDPSATKTLQPGDELIVLGPPEDVPQEAEQQTWHGLDKEGFEGFLTASEDQVALVPSAADDASVAEPVTLKALESADDKHSKLVLTQALGNVYDRATVTIYANVAQTTHGETTHEVVGSGDASQAFQQFALKRTPLTYVSAPTPSGAASTLQVRVNDILWSELPSLYGAGSDQQGYLARLADDGKVTVQFGDSITGARLPSGSDNVVATYRVGTGLSGMVKAGQLSLLMTRPLGVKGATNPLPASGAADPEQLDDARLNAPFTVRTLDRVVSLQDYEDFARAFAGIGKAQATMLWDGEQRLVHVTVAAANGDVVAEDSPLFQNLRLAIETSGDAGQPFQLASYQPRWFNVEANMLVDERYVAETVMADVIALLQHTYAFQQRTFGQPVTQSEIVARVQSVAGVVSVVLQKLYIVGEEPTLNSVLLARRAHRDDSVSPPQIRPAELLLLNPEGIILLEMQP
jgi:Baseplate J-like protein